MKRVGSAVAILIFSLSMITVPSAGAEWLADFYAGLNFSGDTDLTRPPTGFWYDLTDDPDPSMVLGARFGRWFERLPWLGMAGDVSYFWPNIGDADISVVPVSALLMFRAAVSPDREFPRGAIQPYFGIGPALFVSDVDAKSSSDTYSDTSVDVGLDVRLGVFGYFMKNWGVSVEYRFSYFKAHFEDTVSGEKTGFDPRFQTHHGLIAASYRF